MPKPYTTLDEIPLQEIVAFRSYGSAGVDVIYENDKAQGAIRTSTMAALTRMTKELRRIDKRLEAMGDQVGRILEPEWLKSMVKDDDR